MRWAAVVFLAMSVIGCATPFARLSDEELVSQVIEATPLGSDLSTVHDVAKSRFDGSCLGGRVAVQEWPQGMVAPLQNAPQRTRFSAYICAGRSVEWIEPFPSPQYTFVYWLFDDDQHLIDVQVYREVDAL